MTAPDRFLNKAVMLHFIVFLAFAAGCGREREGGAGPPWRGAMRSAAADMMRLGFGRHAMALLEESLGASPAVAEALEVALLYEEKMDPGEAGACLERLFPDHGPAGIRERIVDFYLEGWRWKRAKALLAKKKNDPRQRALQDILSRTKSIHEPFGRTHALSWRINGWKMMNVEDCLHLSSMNHNGFRPENLDFYTTVGWNGEGFQECLELKIMRTREGARLIFGLSASVEPEPGSRDGRSQYILVDVKDGAVHLIYDGPGEGDLGSARRRGYLPLGVWLRLGIEYVPDCSLLDVFQDPGSGMIKAWVEEKETGRRLVTIGLAAAAAFREGEMLAGFFSAREGACGDSVCVLYVDNFTFDN